MKKREKTHKKAAVSECARLGYTLPPEVEALINKISSFYNIIILYTNINETFVI